MEQERVSWLLLTKYLHNEVRACSFFNGFGCIALEYMVFWVPDLFLLIGMASAHLVFGLLFSKFVFKA